jgi:hypothetical protein
VCVSRLIPFPSAQAHRKLKDVHQRLIDLATSNAALSTSISSQSLFLAPPSADDRPSPTSDERGPSRGDREGSPSPSVFSMASPPRRNGEEGLGESLLDVQPDLRRAGSNWDLKEQMLRDELA